MDKARATTARAGLAAKVRFHVGDAERIPLPARTFDAIVCECAFCTFPDKSKRAAEFARVLRPGGRIGLTDVTVADTGLPAELTTLAASVAYIADARPLEQYREILAAAGLVTVHTERHDGAIADMIEQIESRVRLLRMTAPILLADAGVDVDAVLRHCAPARDAVASGRIGHALLVAEKT